MKITICGSIAVYEQMQNLQSELEKLGHEVKIPPIEVANETGQMISVKEFYEIRKTLPENTSWVWERKSQAIRAHFEKVAWSDAILVLNYDKNGIKNYIGANTLLEIGLAFYLHKKIFLLNPIPEIGYKEELLGTNPTVINNDLNLIK
jgi:hypothetical protein